jgi:hypothetical protein
VEGDKHVPAVGSRFLLICSATVFNAGCTTFPKTWDGVSRGLGHCRTPGLAAGPPGEKTQARLANGSLQREKRCFIATQDLTTSGDKEAILFSTWHAQHRQRADGAHNSHETLGELEVTLEEIGCRPSGPHLS